MAGGRNVLMRELELIFTLIDRLARTRLRFG
jgi:hypothetical protein